MNMPAAIISSSPSTLGFLPSVVQGVLGPFTWNDVDGRSCAKDFLYNRGLNFASLVEDVFQTNWRLS